MHPSFNHKKYLLKRQIFAFTGKFRFYAGGKLVMYSQQKKFKLKEDIRVYADISKKQEILKIKSRSIIDFSAAYDVIDMTARQHVGTLRRQGMKSMLRDEWDLLNPAGQKIGTLFEDSIKLATIRRLLFSFLPQNYDIIVGQERVTDIKQQFNPFQYTLNIDFSPDTTNQFDPRLGIAAGILLAAIEGRQN
ncbi:MAG TPA: hypothetical protein EYP74_06365 [Anaerolineales bacterium]|nr:hypothetical protein [Anaerolineales bacterium]